jgi:hypothetical protein
MMSARPLKAEINWRRDGTFDCIDRTGELDQHSITHQFDDATAMTGKN